MPITPVQTWLRFSECSLCRRDIPAGEPFLGNDIDYFQVCNACRSKFRCAQCKAVINSEMSYSHAGEFFCQRCSADFAPAEEMQPFQFPHPATPRLPPADAHHP